MKNENLFKRGRAVLLSAGNRYRKKMAAFLLAFCMLMSNLPCGMIQEVYAADKMLTVNLDGVVYTEIEPGKMQLVEWQTEISSAVPIVIPKTVNYDGKDYTVVSIGDKAFYNNDDHYFVKELSFPDTIESIGESAFEGCGKLEQLELPQNLKEIGKRAFCQCSALSGELEIPASVTSIGESAFANCTKLERVTILNPDIQYGGNEFSQDSSLTHVTLPEGMTSLGSLEQGSMFYGCKSLESIKLPESLTSIPKMTFQNCAGLNKIQIPASVNEIGYSAFLGCALLDEIVVPEGVTEIFQYTFRNCSENLCVTLPDSITYVHSRAFWEGDAEKEKYSSTTVKCTSGKVAALVVGVGHRKIFLNNEPYTVWTFNADGYTYTVTDSENKCVQLEKWEGETRPSGKVVIPEKVTYNEEEYTVTTIAEYAFWACVNVTEIELPDTVTGMGTRVFYNCTNLESIHLPESLTRIEQMTFHYCRKLTELTLPPNLQYIGPYAFNGCTNLQKIEVPGSCTLIDTGAFNNCTGITEVTLHEGLNEIGSNMFGGCTGIKEIRLPDSVEKIGGYAFQDCTGLEKITLNQGLTEIGIGIFKGCEKLTGTIVLPDSVTTIRQEAFAESSLSGVHVGSGLTVLERGAFPDSIRLTTNSPEVWKLLSENTNREDEPVFVWDGTCDVPAGMHAYVEDDIVITGSVSIGDGAIVTILSDASLTVEGTLTNGGTMEIEGELTVDGTLTNNGTMEIEGELTVNGTLTNSGTVKGAGAFAVNENGTLTNNGTVVAEGAFTVDGTITGSGTFGEGMQMTFLLTEDMVANVDDAVYNAAPIVPEPEVSITLGGKKITFVKNTDFTYSYANNTNPGTADITVTPKAGGILKGKAVTTHFTIGKAGQAAPVSCNLTFTVNTDGQTFTAVIARVEGAEYSFDSETWTDENTKSDCRPNTQYTAYIRLKETDTHYAGKAVNKTLKTPKLSQNAPTECKLTFTENEDKQTFTATIEKVNGAEYSFDGETWSGENAKTDCQPNTQYTAYIRLKETDTHYTSEAVRKTLTAPKLSQNAPTECKLTFTENADKQTFTATIEKTEGAEYSFDGETWTDENTKTDCQPNTEYTAYIRLKETDTHYASEAVQKMLKTPKFSRNAPSECELTFTENEDKQTFTATIEKAEGAEYSFDGETWTDENTKTDCQPNTEYTAYIRLKETDTHYASEAVQTTLKTPELKENPGEEGEKLSAPAILTLKSIAGKKGVSVQVTVKRVAGADRYKIYRIVGKKKKLIKTTSSGKTQIQDEKPVQSAKYYAVAVSKDGKVESKAGKAKSIKLAQGTKITKVSPTSKGIKITWKKGKSVKKYVLYRSTKKNSGYVRVTILGKNILSYVDKKAKKGKNYYYKIAVLTTSKSSLMSAASRSVKRK